MLHLPTTASEQLYAKTVNEIENANHETEKRHKKECNKVANVNREREKEVLRIKLEVKDHNNAEIERCKELFEIKHTMITNLNEKILINANKDLLEEIEETKRMNVYMLDTARERYNKYYHRDIEHNKQGIVLTVAVSTRLMGRHNSHESLQEFG